MNRFAAAIIVSAALIGCESSAPRSPASPTAAAAVEVASALPPRNAAAAKEAIELWVTCLQLAAKRLDDGRSDAGVVGAAILSVCRRYFDRWMEIERPSLSPIAYRLFLERMESNLQVYGARAVLDERRRRAMPKGASPPPLRPPPDIQF